MALPFRLPFDYAAAIILFFVAIYVIHFVRRAFRQPPRPEAIGAIDISGDNVKAYDLVQRLFHWSLFVALGLMVLTGVDIFSPGLFGSALGTFGITDLTASLFWHTALVWVLLGLLVIHMIWDLAVARGWGNIWVKGKDFHDTLTRLKNFFGATRDYPKSSKYDPFMKTFHWGAVVSFVVLGITGLYLWNPYGLMPGLSPDLATWLRLFHDFFAFLFVGLVIGHIYFAVLPVNWPVLRSMVTGSLSKDVYLKEFDNERWPLAGRHHAKGAQAAAEEKA